MSKEAHSHPSAEELARRTARFNEYMARLESQPPALPLRCPCCRCKTLRERGGFDICEVCFWEDDGQDDHDADVVRGGPNGALSLTQAAGQLPTTRGLRRAVGWHGAAAPSRGIAGSRPMTISIHVPSVLPLQLQGCLRLSLSAPSVRAALEQIDAATPCSTAASAMKQVPCRPATSTCSSTRPMCATRRVDTALVQATLSRSCRRSQEVDDGGAHHSHHWHQEGSLRRGCRENEAQLRPARAFRVWRGRLRDADRYARAPRLYASSCNRSSA